LGQCTDHRSRRRGDARKLLIIPPTRLMLTRGELDKKQLDRENEVEELATSSSFRSGLRTDVASRRTWEVRREEATRREERNVRKGISAPNSLVSGGRSATKVEEERRLPTKADVKSMIGHLRPAASRRLSVSRPQTKSSGPVSRNIFPEVRLKPVHHVTTVRPTVNTTSWPTVHSEVGRIVILERPEVAGGSVWGSAPTTGAGGEVGVMDDQRSRLRRILAPKPRHHRGPVPTLTTPEEEATEEKEVVAFVCPHVGNSKKLWRAHPDPTSCRHYFICMAPKDQTSPAPAPVRHGCRYGLVFSPETETCVPGARCQADNNNRVVRTSTSTTRRPKQAGGGKKQGLFVEFVEFLIRSRLFNEKVVKSLLDNKELFQ